MDGARNLFATARVRRVLAVATGAILFLTALRPAEAGQTRDAGLRRFADAMNRGDPAAAVALFAPSGLYRGVLVCDPDPCVGAAAIGASLEWEAADRTRHLLLEDGRGELRCISLAPLAERVVYRATVEAGPEGISTLRLEPDTDDGQTARVLAEVARVRTLLEDWAASGGDGPLTLPARNW